MTVTTHYEDFDLADGDYVSPNGVSFTVWTRAEGQWVCAADNHGPSCRRDVLLDPTAAACIALVIEGKLRLFDRPVKGLTFQATAAGMARVETAIRRGGFGQGLDA